jgi:hypothetical protein
VTEAAASRVVASRPSAACKVEHRSSEKRGLIRIRANSDRHALAIKRRS